MTDRITLAHGNGGQRMRRLIEDVFARHLGDRLLKCRDDAVALSLDQHQGEILFTTDGFTVQPLEFPGGNIGSLAIHGTVNDLAVCGATPRYLSLNVFLEEGLEISLLERIVKGLYEAATECDVHIATGDTKVVRRGEVSGIYLATSGIGIRPNGIKPDLSNIKEGDCVLVSGHVGDHGAAVMLAREEFGLHAELKSDAASVIPLTQALMTLPGLRFMRDPTRGGLATVLHEIHDATELGLRIQEAEIPVHEPVRSFCEILGFDPLSLACEGRIVAVVSPEDADAALKLLQSLPSGTHAKMIGKLTQKGSPVILETHIGGERLLEALDDEPLPRIC